MKGIVIVYACIWILAIIGWIMNIVHVCHVDFAAAITAKVVLQLIGIVVAPLGAVLGWIW